MIDYTDDEKEVVSTIRNYIDMYKQIHYIVIKNENNADIPYKVILSKQDYLEYAEEYKNSVKVKQKKK